MYQHGLGVSEDYKQAVYWYQKAADQGYANAQHNLGWIYENGVGVPKNDKQAVYWYQKAADQGNPVSQNRLNHLNTRKNAPKKSVVNSQSKYPDAPIQSKYPDPPAHQRGVITCRTNCWNGDCYRTYSDGTKKHFQAPRKYNPFTSQFEWDSGGC
jgi:TPR repeat protein